MHTHTRRDFLLAGATVTGALLIGVGFGRMPDRIGQPASGRNGGGEVALNGYVLIQGDGRVRVVVPRAEMGQGIHTTLAMLVAEELDVPWAAVSVAAAPLDPLYANVAVLIDAIPERCAETGLLRCAAHAAVRRFGGWLGLHVTGGSTSVRDAWGPMRMAGATARAALMAAGAETFGVESNAVTTDAGVVRTLSGSQHADYGALAALAAEQPRPIAQVRSAPESWRLLGTSPRRLDGEAKANGEAVFGLDVRPSGLLFAAIRHVPTLGAGLAGFDAADATAMRGVRRVVELPGAVAVVADNTWRAIQAAATLTVRASPASADPPLDNAAVTRALDAALALPDAALPAAFSDAQAGASAGTGARQLRARFAVPYLAHACMEPINCTARVTGADCELWLGTQAPVLAAHVAAGVLRTAPARVRVHQALLGGGFGRRVETDMVAAAVAVARAVPGQAVQLVWTREEDIAHDVYRPAAAAELRAVLGADGVPTALSHRVASASVRAHFIARLAGLDTRGIPDKNDLDGAGAGAYDVGLSHVAHVPVQLPVPVGFWRSVGFSHNAFFAEAFIDELAHLAGSDPLAYRRRLLRGRPRHLAVLERAARAAGWGRSLPPGHGQGLAIVESFGSIVAQVVEVAVTAERRLSLVRVTCVIDCGVVLYPDQVRAQMEGGVVFGLSAALTGQIDFAAGAVRQSNFHDYPVLTLAQTPPIEVHLMASRAPPGGVGEPGTPPAAPALANAVFAATGRRIRTLPLVAAGFTVEPRSSPGPRDEHHTPKA